MVRGRRRGRRDGRLGKKRRKIERRGDGRRRDGKEGKSCLCVSSAPNVWKTPRFESRSKNDHDQRNDDGLIASTKRSSGHQEEPETKGIGYTPEMCVCGGGVMLTDRQGRTPPQLITYEASNMTYRHSSRMGRADRSHLRASALVSCVALGVVRRRFCVRDQQSRSTWLDCSVGGPEMWVGVE